MDLLAALLIIGLIGLNAFFVGAEYALLSIRRARLEQLVHQGHTRAVLVGKLLARPSLLFSGLQLGITAASLLLGWLGEASLAESLRSVLAGRLAHFVGPVSHGVASVAAFILITGLLMVLGELAPKTIGYERAEKVSLLVAWPLTVFMQFAHYPVAFMDWLANQAARIFGVQASTGYRETHTPEEVKLIVAGIRQRGLLREELEEMIKSVFDLDRVRVREIMVPWNRITCLPLTADLRTLLDRIVQDQHSRVPIYEGLPDQIVGVLYTKDLLAVILERIRQGIPMDTPFNLRLILHQPMIVPEVMSLNQMLNEARRKQSQMALVVDEFGTFTGLVTIEDVLEQIVGEIRDEYDLEEATIRRLGENVMVVDASISLRELADDFDITLPRGVGFETLAGFILARMGVIPRGGESFVFEGRRYTVVEMDGRRVSKIRIEGVPAAASEAATTADRPPTRST